MLSIPVNTITQRWSFFSYCFQLRSSLVQVFSSHFNKNIIRVSSDGFLDKSHSHLFHFHSLYTSLFLTFSSAYVQVNIYLLVPQTSLTPSYPNCLISWIDALEGLSFSFLHFYVGFLHIRINLSFNVLQPLFKTKDLFDSTCSRKKSLLASLKPNRYVATS